jgi:hypothetical protein
MVLEAAGLLALVEATVGVNPIYAAVKGADWSTLTDPSKSTLLKNLRDHAEEQTVLRGATGDIEAALSEIERSILAESPILACLKRVVDREAPAPYVLYAPQSNGKTTAARAFMTFSLKRLSPAERPYALMLRGSADAKTYFGHMGAGFKAGGTPWFAALIAALSRSPDEINAGKRASILILDDFDDCGPDDVNIKNMRRFCHDLNDLQQAHGKRLEMHVMILTQNRDVGNKLCRINNWKKVGPMPGSYSEPPPEERDAAVLPDPDWTDMPWSKDELLSVVKKAFTQAELKDVSLDFIETGANPGRVKKLIEGKIEVKRSEADGGSFLDPDFM